jgi:hypothetical protein
VKDHWWAVFGRYAFLVLLGIIVSAVIGTVTSTSAAGAGKAVATLVSVALDSVIVPVALAYSYLMYKDLSSHAHAAPQAATVKVGEEGTNVVSEETADEQE